MPALYTLDQEQQHRVQAFYDNGSVFTKNKYIVGFYGPYVNSAIEYMKLMAVKDRTNNNKTFKDTAIYKTSLDNWLSTFWDSTNRVLEMRWNCKSITLPTVKLDVEKSPHAFDAIKALQYPVVKGATHGNITIDVVDERNMMWYQFFNTLKNRFFTPQVLKPRSSFQKLSMFAIALQDGVMDQKSKDEHGLTRNNIDAYPAQVFEYNSIVPISSGDIKLEQQAGSILEFSIEFMAPDTFQGTFNRDFKGLADNTSDYRDRVTMGKDRYGKDAYNGSVFESPKSGLMAPPFIYPEDNKNDPLGKKLIGLELYNPAPSK